MDTSIVEPIWKIAVEQLPALSIALAAFVFIFVKGMRFFSSLTTTFMRHQEERDRLFSVTLREIGKECHEHANAREGLLVKELHASREVLSEFTKAAARHEQTMTRVASALEKSA